MTHPLSERDREILRILISDYISTADPIGSRSIAKKHPGGLSPATIRNVMSDLTELGFLTQPHTSAGRIPTNMGFRYYVNSLLTKRDLTTHEMEVIRERCREDEKGITSVLQRASHILALVSHYVGIVVTPSASRMIFKKIEFMRLSDRRLLGIFVSQEGFVENRLIELTEELSYPELERISNYCNSAFLGLTLDDALQKIEKELTTERADYDKLLKKAMLFSKQVIGDIGGIDLVVDGEEQLLDAPEFAEVEKFKKLLEALNEKREILKLLENCRESDGVSIFIGSDTDVTGMGTIGIVGAPYLKDGKMIGTLGVIGPMRMDYGSVVPIVDFTAKVLSDALED